MGGQTGGRGGRQGGRQHLLAQRCVVRVVQPQADERRSRMRAAARCGVRGVGEYEPVGLYGGGKVTLDCLAALQGILVQDHLALERL